MKILLFTLILAATSSLASAENITLVWDANPAPEAVVSYTLAYGTRVDDLSQQVVVAATTATVDLGPGKWFFAVCATNDEGTSGLFCEAVSTRIMKPAPGKVQGLKVVRLPIQGSARPIQGRESKWYRAGYFYPATDSHGATLYEVYRLDPRRNKI